LKKIALGLIALLVLVVAASGCTTLSNNTKNVNSTLQKELGKYNVSNQTLKNDINKTISPYIEQLKSRNITVPNLKITQKSGYTSVTLNTTSGSTEFRFYQNGTIKQIGKI
jgi:uncharacterized protein YpmS